LAGAVGVACLLNLHRLAERISAILRFRVHILYLSTLAPALISVDLLRISGDRQVEILGQSVSSGVGIYKSPRTLW